MKLFFIILTTILFIQCSQKEIKINREILVTRHNVIISGFDSLSSLTVGNGKFAFTVDATGLQTFPELYANGVCLGTQSEWGWHSFPDTSGFDLEETFMEYDFHGRKIPYSVQWDDPERKKDAANYFRQNPHRLNLATIGFEMKRPGGQKITPADISEVNQKLNMWTGEISSEFKIDGEQVKIITYCHQNKDIISSEITSNLIKNGLLKVALHFSYPSGKHTESGNTKDTPDKHLSELVYNEKDESIISRKLDSTRYYVKIKSENGKVEKISDHKFLLSNVSDEDQLSFSCSFSTNDSRNIDVPDFSSTKENSKSEWKKFWNSGGAVDFYGSTDPRAFELERRIILSQYLTKIQCAGSYPPQETGLTFNSWFGKFHLEMHWWHAVHFALWNRPELLEKSMGYYSNIFEQSKDVAIKQGFKGIRWPKMTGPDGINSPSGVGSFLIWQQPHYIYFAELLYRHYKNDSVINKYSALVFETAEFMASYAQYDPKSQKYILGPALIPAQECFPPQETINPPLELAYWHWGLSTAQKWRERMGLERISSWDSVLTNLSSLAVDGEYYLFAESAKNSYSEKTYDHPAVLGAFGMMPKTPLADSAIMHKTFHRIFKEWQWERTWGWDFPLTAMTAVRLGEPEKAVDALLMNITTNTYLVNGHNYQDERLRIYLPGNGGLLTAVAMMCAGYDGCETELPGFPDNGEWKVRWENLERMP